MLSRRRIIWLLPFPSPSPVSKLSLPVSPVELTDGSALGEDGGGAKSCDGEKAWSSINYTILSG